MILRIALLCVVCVVLLASSPSPSALLGAGGGLAVGVALALVGLRHTTFEVTPQGRFYTPNKWLGLVVTALFFGRLAARLFTISGRAAAMQAGGPGAGAPQMTPLTLGFLYLVAAYYVAYYAGVLWKGRSAAPSMPTAGGV